MSRFEVIEDEIKEGEQFCKFDKVEVKCLEIRIYKKLTEAITWFRSEEKEREIKRVRHTLKYFRHTFKNQF